MTRLVWLGVLVVAAAVACTPPPRAVVAEFVARGSARELDTRCVAEMRRPPFVTQ